KNTFHQRLLPFGARSESTRNMFRRALIPVLTLFWLPYGAGRSFALVIGIESSDARSADRAPWWLVWAVGLVIGCPLVALWCRPIVRPGDWNRGIRSGAGPISRGSGPTPALGVGPGYASVRPSVCALGSKEFKRVIRSWRWEGSVGRAKKG